MDTSSDILRALGLDPAALTGGTLAARSPSTAPSWRRCANTAWPGACRHHPRPSGQPGLARRAGAAPWRAAAPVRRNPARPQARAGPAGEPGGRQDPGRGRRRSAGNDRHLRLRRGPVAPAVRPDHRLRASRPSHDGDLASAGRGGRDQRLQLPGGRVVLERRAGAGLRQCRGVEAVGKDALDRAGLPGAVRAGRAAPAMRRRDFPKC